MYTIKTILIKQVWNIRHISINKCWRKITDCYIVLFCEGARYACTFIEQTCQWISLEFGR